MEPLPSFETLSRKECDSLLRAHGAGRLAFVGRDGQPLIFPLNYAISAESIVFRTATGTRLSEAIMSRVAFEIDHVDEMGGLGWSVLVQGVLEEITDGIDPGSEALRRLSVHPLAPGERERWMAIRPTEITGRRVRQGAGSLFV